jgi:transposase
LLPHLNERQQRLALAVEARLLGHGGVRAVAQVAGVSETTVRKGVVELEAGEAPFPPGRVRRPGGGRKAAAQQDPDLLPALLALVEPDERGDPMSPLRWTTKSLRHLAEELTRQGHPVSAPTVGRLLKREGFSLQANVKTLEGAQHPDRDAQFRYLNEQVKDHQADGEPVISVDTKKREQLGRLPMAGREWRPKGEPVEVEDHHFFFTGPAGHPVRDLRPHPQHRLGQRRRRSRHLRLRGRVHPPLVAGTRKPGLPEGIAAADHRGRGRLQRLPLPRLEERTGHPGGRDRAGDHGLPLPARHLQMEQGGMTLRATTGR